MVDANVSAEIERHLDWAANEPGDVRTTIRGDWGELTVLRHPFFADTFAMRVYRDDRYYEEAVTHEMLDFAQDVDGVLYAVHRRLADQAMRELEIEPAAS